MLFIIFLINNFYSLDRFLIVNLKVSLILIENFYKVILTYLFIY